MRTEAAASTGAPRPLTIGAATLLAPRPRLADLVPAGWAGAPLRDRTRGAFPASLSRTWGEASWTGHDLWMNNPMFAAARASAKLSTITPVVDLDAGKQTYRRLRQAVEERRGPIPRDEAVEEVPTPTGAMLALGHKVVTWTTTVVVIALALVVGLLGVELGLVDVIPR
jgi:hypothetical protein